MKQRNSSCRTTVYLEFERQITAMQRDRLFDILRGMLAAKGRDEALLGGRLDVARHAFCRMAPEDSLVHSYFEIPLLGPAALDVHCSLTHEQSAWPLSEDANDAWRAALSWFHDAGPIETKADEVMLMAEADTGTGGASQTGMYLIQRERADLVEPFLDAIGESSKAVAWQRFTKHLPQGWYTTYVGSFPGRGDGLLRVNAHPAVAGAVNVEEACERFGVFCNSDIISLCRDLLKCTEGLDVQLDVDELGDIQGTFGLEFYLKDSADEFLSDGSSGNRAMVLLENADLADGRWRQAADACRSCRIALLGEHGPEPYVVSVRPFSIKFKVLDGKPLPAKLYLRGDAGPAGGQ